MRYNELLLTHSLTHSLDVDIDPISNYFEYTRSLRVRVRVRFRVWVRFRISVRVRARISVKVLG